MKDSIVLDTNVLVSALLTKNRAVSAPFQILSRVLSGQVVVLVNNAIENEYRGCAFAVMPADYLQLS